MPEADSFDAGVLQRVEAEVVATRKSALTARRLDEIVLKAAGFAAVAQQCREDIDHASWAAHSGLDDRLHERLGVRRPSGGPLGCAFLFALLPAASAAGTVFGRHPAEDWTKLLSVGAPLSGAGLLLVALIGNVRPMPDRVAFGSAVVLGIYGVTGVLGLRRLELVDWERTSIIAAIGVGLVCVLWLYGVRLLRRDQARELDLVPEHEEALVREEIAKERDRLVAELEKRLRSEGADLAELAELRVHAKAVAEARGVSGLEPAPGPVGAAIIVEETDSEQYS